MRLSRHRSAPAEEERGAILVTVALSMLALLASAALAVASPDLQRSPDGPVGGRRRGAGWGPGPSEHLVGGDNGDQGRRGDPRRRLPSSVEQLRRREWGLGGAGQRHQLHLVRHPREPDQGPEFPMSTSRPRSPNWSGSTRSGTRRSPSPPREAAGSAASSPSACRPGPAAATATLREVRRRRAERGAVHRARLRQLRPHRLRVLRERRDRHDRQLWERRRPTIRFPNNIAVGSDHEVTVKTAASLPLIDAPNACDFGTPGPNSALTETGNNSGILGDGLIGPGTFSEAGRRGSGAPMRGCRRKRNHRDRGRRLDRLEPAVGLHPTDADYDLGDIPRSCQRDQFTGTNGTTAFVKVNAANQPNLPATVVDHLKPLPAQDQAVKLLQRCFAHYLGKRWTDGGSFGNPDGPGKPARDAASCPHRAPAYVFSLNSSTTESPDLWDIQYTPRFAYVPQLAGSFPSGSSRRFLSPASGRPSSNG